MGSGAEPSSRYAQGFQYSIFFLLGVLAVGVAFLVGLIVHGVKTASSSGSPDPLVETAADSQVRPHGETGPSE